MESTTPHPAEQAGNPDLAVVLGKRSAEHLLGS